MLCAFPLILLRRVVNRHARHEPLDVHSLVLRGACATQDQNGVLQ